MTRKHLCKLQSLDPEDYVSVPVAARLLHVNNTTIYRRVQAGKMKSLCFAGLLCIPKPEIRRLITKFCENCNYKLDGHCSVREAVDVVSPCPDWLSKF